MGWQVLRFRELQLPGSLLLSGYLALPGEICLMTRDRWSHIAQRWPVFAGNQPAQVSILYSPSTDNKKHFTLWIEPYAISQNKRFAWEEVTDVFVIVIDCRVFDNRRGGRNSSQHRVRCVSEKREATGGIFVAEGNALEITFRHPSRTYSVTSVSSPLCPWCEIES